MTDNDLSTADIVPVGEWGKLVQILDKDKMPMPFVREVFLLESNIAGLGFISAVQKKTSSLGVGSPLVLRREPKNPYDALAIRIQNEQGEKLGYVPRRDNPILSRLMDAGKLLYAKVKEKKTTEDWLSISIGIYMRDM